MKKGILFIIIVMAICSLQTTRVYALNAIDAGGGSTPTPTTANPNFPTSESGCVSYCQQKHPGYNSYDSAGYDNCNTSCKNQFHKKPTPKPTQTPKPTTDEEYTYYPEIKDNNFQCGGLLSDSLLREIVKIYRTITLLLVVGCIVLGMTDFVKATGSDDADAIKKATKRFTNRIIIVIIIAILPTLLSFILTIFGDADMKNCLDKINI